MDTQMRINGGRVRALREAKSWSQEHLADAAGVSVRTVQRVEADGVGSAETRLALAAALEVPVQTLVFETGAERPGRVAIPAGAWFGWGAGAICATGAVAYSYFSGAVDSGSAARALGIVSGLLGATLGLMGALRGVLEGRGPAA